MNCVSMAFEVEDDTLLGVVVIAVVGVNDAKVSVSVSPEVGELVKGIEGVDG